MWWRFYLALAALRVCLALYPSYLHPDEHFQGPEVMAGHIFQYPVQKTWEFTSVTPIRSVFPLWPVYGLVFLALKWISPILEPLAALRWLRMLMLSLSLLLEDSAIYQLADTPRQRQLALLLVSSSYVTWTWQVHTFSNSIETLTLLWTLVLLKHLRRKILSRQKQLQIGSLLGFLVAFGIFNRVTFPAFLVGPGILFAPQVLRRPWLVIPAAIFATATALVAILVDSKFYMNDSSFKHMLQHPVITPWNNMLYNTQRQNLASHGLHPYYQHLVVNLPQLIGPAIIMMFNKPRLSLELASLISGLAVLSCLPHQEARFIIPAVPLVLSIIRLPVRFRKAWIASWIVFNTFMGLVMGIYHQGGVVPAQMFLSNHSASKAFWWKTYSPPTWMSNCQSPNLETIDLMGFDKDGLVLAVCGTDVQTPSWQRKVLVAPSSADFLDKFVNRIGVDSGLPMRLTEAWSTKRHLNLDDLDFAEDGVVTTVRRLLGRRGLVVWNVECRNNVEKFPPALQRDW